jgi:hypothetical protein
MDLGPRDPKLKKKHLRPSKKSGSCVMIQNPDHVS